MTRLEALIELRDKVGSGDYWKFGYFGEVHSELSSYGGDAFRGSLDAAMALHESLLPEWEVSIYFDIGGAEVDLGGPGMRSESGKAETPARAWLLAILEALIVTAPALTHLPQSGKAGKGV